MNDTLRANKGEVVLELLYNSFIVLTAVGIKYNHMWVNTL